MEYQALNEKTVVDYVLNRPALKKIFPEGSHPTAHEIGDGNLNQVFAVDDGEHSAIVKQALPYLRVSGPSWPLALDRMHFEVGAMLLSAKLAPAYVPKVYDRDGDLKLVVMENLNRHEVMRKPLVARKKFPLFAEHMSDYLSRVLFMTSDLYLSGVEKKKLQSEFINFDLCKMQEEFVFTNPFMDSPENNWNPLLDREVREVRQDGTLKVAIAKIKEGYMTHAQAIIHSDLHTGSIMLNERDTRVIDPECSFCGPMGFDTGALIENLVLNYVSHFAHTPDAAEREEYQEYLLATIEELWRKFAEKFDRLWAENPTGDLMPAKYWDFPGGKEAFADFRRSYILGLLRDTAAYGGCKMLRRMMGIVSVWDISSIADGEKRAVCEEKAIRIGRRWVLEHDRVTDIGDLIDMVREEAAK